MIKIYEGYSRFEVSYHNDLHGFDVAQMMYYLLYGDEGLIKVLQLSQVDVLATLFAAYCHDYKHDGFNNGYHAAIKSERFREHGADALQEKYHFAESWKVVEREDML